MNYQSVIIYDEDGMTVARYDGVSPEYTDKITALLREQASDEELLQ